MTFNEMYFEMAKKQIYENVKMAFSECYFYATNYQICIPAYDNFTYDFFSNIPLLEKKVLLQHSKEFLRNNLVKENLITETTSGSEANPLLCYKSRNEKLLYSIDLWKMRKKIIQDLSPKDRFVHFYVSRKQKDKRITDIPVYEDNILHLPLFDLSPDKLVLYWNEILKFQPRWMHGTPSTIYNLAIIVLKYNLPRYFFDFIELTGEYLDEQKLNFIKETFRCRVANQYGAREFWLLAYGCDNNSLHINEKNVFIEEVYSPKYERNELIVTSLQNYTWPLIRYRLGDIGEIRLNNCNCRIHSNFVLNLTWGRQSECCNLGNVLLSKVFFSYIVRKANDMNANITQYQIVKQSDDKILINLVGDRNNKEMVLELFRDELSQRNIFVNINICYKDFIMPDNTTGKTKEFIDMTRS